MCKPAWRGVDYRFYPGAQVLYRVMNGYSREELIGHSIDILNKTPVLPATNIAYLNHIRESGNLKYETFHRHKNGTLFPIEVSTTLIKVGERDLLMGIDRDITGGGPPCWLNRR